MTDPTKTPTKPKAPAKTKPKPPTERPCNLPPCPTAHTPIETCRCSCRGRNHGRYGRYG